MGSNWSENVGDAAQREHKAPSGAGRIKPFTGVYKTTRSRSTLHPLTIDQDTLMPVNRPVNRDLTPVENTIGRALLARDPDRYVVADSIIIAKALDLDGLLAPRAEQLPTLEVEDLDDGYAILPPTIDPSPGQPFLAYAVYPCPVGRQLSLRPGSPVGGQMLTACHRCGYVMSSTAGQGHATKVVDVVVATLHAENDDEVTFRRLTHDDTSTGGFALPRKTGDC